METGEEVFRHASIASMFLDRVRTDPDKPALCSKAQGASDFIWVTWADLLRDVYASVVLYERLEAFQPGDRVVQIRDNSRQWITFDLATMFLKWWHVPLSSHLSNDQVVAIARHCKPAMIVANPKAIHQHLLALHDDSVCWTVVDDESDDPLADPAASLDEVVRATSIDEMLSFLQAKVDALNPDDVCSLVYTSGTTGTPKGVMLSHRNLAFDASSVVHAYQEKPADKRLSFLPFSHLYARTCDVYTWIARGSQLVLAKSRDTILADCQATQPTLINGVPYFYQKVAEGLKAKGMLDIDNSLRSALGGEIRMCASGGAPLTTWTIHEYQKQSITILEGYGLTESSPVITVSTENAHRTGSVGKPIHGVEIRVTKDGEVETRGPHVMQGYYDDEAATNEIMDGEWLRTGDLGQIDDDGFLWITGRQKEMLVLSTGRKINPSTLELAISSDPLVAQVVVCGEGEKCLSALIVPQPEQLRARIKEARLWVFSKRQALAHPRVRAWYREVIDRQLADRADFEQIGHFTILGQGFTPETGEMTPKLSLRRNTIAENYRGLIQQMYKPRKVSWFPWQKR